MKTINNKKIFELMEKRNLTYALFAEKMGVNKSSIFKMIRSQDLTLSRILQLSDVLECSIGDILTKEALKKIMQ